jgi:hypothetical protein
MLSGRSVAMGLLMVVCQLAVAGCGGKDFDKSLYPIEGEVFFRGKPAVGCIVSFHPTSTGEGAGAPCLGTTDSNGKFRVTTREPFDGIAAGEYEVSFSLPGEGSSRDPNGDAAPDKLPAKYQFPGSSGFKVTITSSTSTLDRFELK